MFLLWMVGLSLFDVIDSTNQQFPPWFKFGAATAAHQTEGGWNVSDKSPSIWDVGSQTRPDLFINHATGEVACDSYHQWKRDVQMVSELGVDFYRFSISWTRLLPSGFSNHISEDGARFYNNLIDDLLKHDIEPLVTLYHFDLPQSLQDLGGWTNPLISDWFSDYARVAYELFGDRVKTWITLNEPLIFCENVYNSGRSVPTIKSEGIGNYICNKNAMLAHAKAWRIYDEEFRPKYNGRISIINQLIWYEAEDGNDKDGEILNEYCTGMYSHPIFSKDGGWPKIIETIIAEKSQKEGFNKSRLPRFTEEEKKFIKGTYDFYGVNYYTGRLGVVAKNGEQHGSWPLGGAPDLNMNIVLAPNWTLSSYWFVTVPNGLRKMLNWIKNHYGDVEMIIGENGFLSTERTLKDQSRIEYYKSNLEQVLQAVYEDGVNVTAYTAWSLMDNFEWVDGYSSFFGLYAVDFTSPERTRTPRWSAHYYANVVRSKSLNVSEDYTEKYPTGRASSLKSLTFFVYLLFTVKMLL